MPKSQSGKNLQNINYINYNNATINMNVRTSMGSQESKTGNEYLQ
jgi:hypothetical protein